MTEQELLVDCLTRLNSAEIQYMVTGSMASNFWGIPRSTHDLDFVVQIPPSSVSKFVKAFASDFYLDEQSIRDAYNPPYQFNAIDERSALKVDFWFPAKSEFERCMFDRRQKRTIFKVPAWIATAEDIILHKLYWDKISSSERQRGDVAGVFAVQKDSLDEAYLRNGAKELGVENSLNLLLSGEIKPKAT